MYLILLGELLNTYESINHCANELGIYFSIISDILKGKRKSYKNMVMYKVGEEFNYVKSSKARDMTKFYK